MADFYAPQFQPQPDILGQYIRGQMGPLQVQGAQQQLAMGANQLAYQQQAQPLELEQLRLAVQRTGLLQNAASGLLRGSNPSSGTAGTGADNPLTASGGIQSGPQGTVDRAPNAPAQPSGSFDGSFGSSASPSSGISMGSILAMKLLGQDITPTLKEAQEYELKQRQLQAQGPLDLIDSVFNSATPARTVMANPSLMAKWPQIAAQLGIDPVKDFNDTNVRRGLALAGNNLRGMTGQPAKDYPVLMQHGNGAYGQQLDVDPITGKRTQVAGREMPSFTQVDKYDHSSNTTTKVPVQTGGWGMQGVGPTGATMTVGGPAGGAPGSLGFNAGMKAPTDPELKAAMFGSEMRSGLQTMRQMENRGFNLSPSTRTAIINAATSEDEGAIKQLMSQEFLTHMSKDDQTYVAALMPMLQAAGHDQSGARLTTSQIRQNLESLLPVDVHNTDALAQVNKNREGFYQGLLTQAGSAVRLPQYESTLGADLRGAQNRSAPPGAIAHLKAHPELAAAFRAKYGYLPQ